MSFFFAAAVLAAFIFGVLNGKLEEVSRAALGEAGQAVKLTLELLGMLCLWSGMMAVAERSGITKGLAKAFSPVLRRVFSGMAIGSKALAAISMNMTANLLGLGNAATPLGIAAMKEMQNEEGASSAATNNMVIFVVLNTASLQLLPTTVAILRMEAGASRPLEILPAVWAASAASVAAGVLAAKALGACSKNGACSTGGARWKYGGRKPKKRFQGRE